MRYADRVLKFKVHGFATPAESQVLAGKVIDMLEGYKGTQDEIGRLKRYLRQEHRFTKSQERDIESMWTIYETARKKPTSHGRA